MYNIIKMQLKAPILFVSVLVGIVALDAGVQAAPSATVTAPEKCEPATDYRFFIWRRIYQPCQYLCAGLFVAFENEDDGTPCSTLSVPDGGCLKGICVAAAETPTTTVVSSTRVAFKDEPRTTSENFHATFDTVEPGNLSSDNVHDNSESETTELAAEAIAINGKTGNFENATEDDENSESAAAEDAKLVEDSSMAAETEELNSDVTVEEEESGFLSETVAPQDTQGDDEDAETQRSF